MLKGVNVPRFLARRFLVLLVLGLCHLLFISNVDILTLYAVCGLLLVPALRFRASVLAVLGVIGVWSVIPTGLSLPPDAALRIHAAEATRVYRDGTFVRDFCVPMARDI